jgi:thioredoxin-like negative regulator of GroEL
LEEYRTTADAEDRYTRIQKNQAADIRGKLAQSLALMPDFGPAQQLLGFLEMVQEESLADADQHLQRAVQLEPENLSYRLSLAQFQFRTRNLDAARQTLTPLLRPNVDAKLRATAEQLMEKINQP